MKHIYSLLAALLCAAALNAATIQVSPGSGKLKAAIADASAGDVLVLQDGEYTESEYLQPAVPLTIKAADGAKPVIRLAKYIEIKAGFTLQGLTICSTAHIIQALKGDALYDVTLDDCIFRQGGATANSARAFTAKETPDKLRSLTIRNCTFDGGTNGAGTFIYLHPGDGIEVATPLQGSVLIDHCTFYNSTNTRGVYLANIDGCSVTNCIFMNPEERSGAVSYALYGSNSKIENSLSFNAPVKLSAATATACINRNPYFVGAAEGNFRLYKNSPAVNAGTDGTTLGDPRWGVSDELYDNSNDPYIPYKKPYSMAPTTTTVKLLWQMNEETEATNAVVYYGTNPDDLSQSVSTDAGWNVEGEGYMHVITLTGLQPNTRYYFTVGASATRRYDKICSTKTAPEAGTGFRIFTISDIHGNSCSNWSNMQDFICGLGCDIALMNGDFVSSKGNDRNWNNYFFTPGAEFLSQVPVMSSVGNHETGDPFTYRWASYYDYFHQFAHEGESEDPIKDPRCEAYFHFAYGNADVIMLNLNGDPSSPEFLPGSKQYHWADSILGTCTRPWIIICHHVGIHTTGYHGQWADEPRQMGALFEKYAAAPYNKRIISLSGDDHSFEHLYKDGVHYLRPGCGRNSNYSQQKQLGDYKYSMFYKQVSCFSTLDMSADASTIALTAYDSVGNIFYKYSFVHDGEVINPSVNFTVPATKVTVEDSIQLRWFTFDPKGDAKVSFYYSQTPDATGVEGMKPLATNLSGKEEKLMWHTRDIYPKGDWYIYAVISSGGQTFMGGNTAVVNLIEDTTPPPAPTALSGYKNSGVYHLTWRNPTHLVHLDNLLTDFSGGAGQIETAGDDGAAMAVSVADGALRCDYSITKEWATASADFVFDAATDMHQTPVLTFRLKGNGTGTDLRIVCKNISSTGHEDWWYTESINLSSTDWQDKSLDLSRLQAFDWYANSDERNQMDGVVRISFGVSTGSAVAGTFWLDDLHLSGDIYPAPDFAQTVIVRKADAFPSSPADGTEVYRGKAETCPDPAAVVGEVYYYAAFASDDRGNWSAPDAGAQWKSENVQEGDGVNVTQLTPAASQKFFRDGQLYVRHASGTCSVTGAAVR